MVLASRSSMLVKTHYLKWLLLCVRRLVSKGKQTSLRAAGATKMFKAGVPEKMIQVCTGHRSLHALRLYERSSTEQQGAVSDILSMTESVCYESALQVVCQPPRQMRVLSP